MPDRHEFHRVEICGRIFTGSISAEGPCLKMLENRTYGRGVPLGAALSISKGTGRHYYAICKYNEPHISSCRFFPMKMWKPSLVNSVFLLQVDYGPCRSRKAQPGLPWENGRNSIRELREPVQIPTPMSRAGTIWFPKKPAPDCCSVCDGYR